MIDEGWPICHELPMYYNKASDLYACQNPTCRFAQGVTWLYMLNNPEGCSCKGISHEASCPEGRLSL